MSTHIAAKEGQIAQTVLLPGDPLRAWDGDGVGRMSVAEKTAARESLGLDKPLPVQYGKWLGDLVQGKLGLSYKYKRPGAGGVGGGSMIEVKHLFKSFGDKEVLKDINIVFEDGKTNLIIGQSGAGKTVLMRSLTGLLDPTKGEVLYDGRNFVNMTKKDQILMRREMGMIFQGAALFDSLTVLENVRFPLDMFSDMTAQERDKRAMECLDRVNLAGAEQKFPGEISGGMQKRVAIARAIVMNPKYLFCDEPNSGLDPKTSLVIDELLTSITREFNMTTIINTHDMNSVLGIGENIVFIADGKKEWCGTYWIY